MDGRRGKKKSRRRRVKTKANDGSAVAPPAPAAVGGEAGEGAAGGGAGAAPPAPHAALLGAGARRARLSDSEDEGHAGAMRGGAGPEEDSDGPGEFEDPFGDDYEEEDVLHDDTAGGAGGSNMNDQQLVAAAGTPDEAMDELAEGVKQVWRPGIDRLGEDEELDFDNSAYIAFHRLRTEWPCLSFDIIPDKLGTGRTRFPLTAYLLAGTQADRASQNKLEVLKVSDMHKTKNDDDSDDEAASDSDEDGEAVVTSRSIAHPTGAVNRVRVGADGRFAAAWSDAGIVNIWDVSPHAAAIDNPAAVPSARAAADPVFTFSGHPTEGWSMAWSRMTLGRLATGDCKKHIYVWDPQEAGWAVDAMPFRGHTDSVEDLAWSPNEADVFASCGVDRTVRIWDARERRHSMLSIEAHATDVNVISWNPVNVAPFLMVSGADDGSFKVWDLREFSADAPVAHFKYHTGPITSVEWHPTDENTMVVASDDDQVTIWDMSVEEDTDAAAAAAAAKGGAGAPSAGPDLSGIPPQLLFVHMGQKHVKEAHFHPQIPDFVVTTAQDGINLFKPNFAPPEADEEEGGGM